VLTLDAHIYTLSLGHPGITAVTTSVDVSADLSTAVPVNDDDNGRPPPIAAVAACTIDDAAPLHNVAVTNAVAIDQRHPRQAFDSFILPACLLGMPCTTAVCAVYFVAEDYGLQTPLLDAD
jgi:hypothetical protein